MARSPTFKQSARPPKRGGKREQDVMVAVPSVDFVPKVRRNLEPIKALNESQHYYLESMKHSVLTFGTGPAGTGKTWLCAALAAKLLEEGTIDKIVITRPAMEAGESLGFLPGEIEDKFDPYLQPFRDVLNERLGKTYTELAIKRGKIEAAPLAYMRGRTFKKAFVILDEAQNTTPTQMKMFLTRIGEDCTVVVNGDMAQTDLRGPSGLEDAVRRLSHVDEISFAEFTTADIVRSGLVQIVVAAYENH